MEMMSNQKSCYKLNVWENILMHLSSLNNIIDVFCHEIFTIDFFVTVCTSIYTI